jgi:hypothetical protein
MFSILINFLKWHGRYGFLDKRPDGVAFDETKKKVCLLEFTRAMDAREDWEKRKEKDMTKRYAQYLDLHQRPITRQTRMEGFSDQLHNMNSGYDPQRHRSTFFSKVSNLGVCKFKNREDIRTKVENAPWKCTTFY